MAKEEPFTEKERPTDEKIINALIGKYGYRPQSIKFIEEASELIQNLAKGLLTPEEIGDDLSDPIRHEIVDTMITLHGLRIIFGKDKTERMYWEKLQKLINEHGLII